MGTALVPTTYDEVEYIDVALINSKIGSEMEGSTVILHDHCQQIE
jgi:hypothetical protein